MFFRNPPNSNAILISEMITMERMQLAVGFLLKISVVIALSCAIIGGTMYLYHHGNDLMSYNIFLGEPKQNTSFSGILLALPSLSPKAFIQFGILVLIISQMLRIALVTWFFAKLKDHAFTGISIFVLLAVVCISFGVF